MVTYKIGDAVERREDRPTRRATITAIDASGEQPLYHLDYEEGGDGWWPESAIEAAGVTSDA
jgi:hypothetical protein